MAEFTKHDEVVAAGVIAGLALSISAVFGVELADRWALRTSRGQAARTRFPASTTVNR